jgi:uncharacterized membrane protein
VSGLAQAFATVPVLMALLVIARGVVRAPTSASAAAAQLAASVMLALEFLLAAGLLRLSATHDFLGLGAVAAIVLLRKVIGTGIRFALRALDATRVRRIRA